MADTIPAPGPSGKPAWSAFRMEETDGQLRFYFAWFRWRYPAYLALAVSTAWYLLYGGALWDNGQPFGATQWMLVAAVAAVVYLCLAMMLNHTAITVSGEGIRVWHGPLPLIRGFAVTRRDISQLYVSRRQRVHPYYLIYSRYQVNLLLTSGTMRILVPNLKNAGDGKIIERKIERLLGIANRPVDGEHPGG
jgi:hypothetical protein